MNRRRREAITLTAADTVVFVELDWVGQSRGCHVIHLLAHGDTLDKEMAQGLFDKLEIINRVLDEDVKVLAKEEPKQIGTYGEMLQRLIHNAQPPSPATVPEA